MSEKERKEDVPDAPSAFALKVYEDVIRPGGLKTLLDLGAGRGTDAVFFNGRGMNVIAVDVAPMTLSQIALAAPQVTTVLSDIRDVKFPNGVFDCIYARLSPHNFTDAEIARIFANVFGMLKEGGYFFAECKSPADPKDGKGKPAAPDMERDGRRPPSFSPDYFREKAGRFKVVDFFESAPGKEKDAASRVSGFVARKA